MIGLVKIVCDEAVNFVMKTQSIKPQIISFIVVGVSEVLNFNTRKQY